MDWSAIAVAFVSGGAGGTLMGLFKPLVDWEFEVRRDRRQERRNAITSFRGLIYREASKSLEPDDYHILRHLLSYANKKERNMIDKFAEEKIEEIAQQEVKTGLKNRETVELVDAVIKTYYMGILPIAEKILIRIEKKFKFR